MSVIKLGAKACALTCGAVLGVGFAYAIAGIIDSTVAHVAAALDREESK